MNLIVNADEESITLGLLFAKTFGAGVAVLESAETKGRGQAAVGKFAEAGIEVELIQRKGDWLRALRVATRAFRYDLAIVGKMWRRGVSGFLFGILPRQLLADVRSDLLIVRRPRTDIARLLIAVSTGPAQKQVLRWAGMIANGFNARPLLFHVTEPVPGMFGGLAGADESIAQFLRSNTAEARALQTAAETLRGLKLEPELKLAHGAVEAELAAEARAADCDLIVIGSSYSGARSSRWFMQGVTESVIKHAPCPVLVVRGLAASTQSRASTDNKRIEGIEGSEGRPQGGEGAKQA